MSRWPSLRERLFANLIIDPSGCVLWTGACNPNGYGTISANGRQSYVHRVMFEMFEGPIPEDRPQLDHVKDRGCVHKNCCQPLHLEPVTNRENVLRGESAKLSDETVAILLRLYYEGESVINLARAAGVHRTTLHRRFRRMENTRIPG